ncbi:MAG: LysR family transcriptional regulator [Myxococcales bacterium FL481]|nr:MAG: LysR family transcriptional regulator [Myxococcales bacterium FL481]
MKQIHEVLPEPRLDVRDLRLIAAIEEAGTLTKAAALLCVTQSALSHHLARLEERLGVAMFERVGRTLHKTAAARLVLSEGQDLQQRLLALEQKIAAAGRDPIHIQLHVQCSTAFFWLPELMKSLDAGAEPIEVGVAHSGGTRLLQDVLSHKAQLALCFEDKLPPGLRAVELFKDRLAVVMDPSHPWAQRRRIGITQLASQRLFSFDLPEKELRALGNRLFGDVPERNRPTVRRIPLTETILALVQNGLGIALMAPWTVVPHLERGDIVARSLSSPGAARRWKGVYREDYEHRCAAEAVLARLKFIVTGLARRAEPWLLPAGSF